MQVNNNNENKCVNELDSLPLAMAYVPIQEWETPYDVKTGFERGTMFPSLDKPFIGKEAIRL